MINTIADLLEAFLEKETDLLKEYDIIKHPGIIGDMYEGLTKEVLNKSIFENLDLHVRAGKIKNSENHFSGEIDCMLVVGEGEKIPYTDKYIYDCSKVIAVIQVKKNLYSDDIQSSLTNLRSVIDVTEEREGENYHGNMIRSSFRMICHEETPLRSEISSLNFEKEMIYHILTLEAFYPIRIVWGYNGFASEYSLREGFIKHLEKNISTPEKKIRGLDPLGLPNLIICKNNSIIKNNGIPYAYPIDEKDWWLVLASSNKNPAYYFLELIWTRLNFMFELPYEIFGEDLEVDQLHPLLKAKAQKTETMTGWGYSYVEIPQHILSKPLDNKKWEPAFLNMCQFLIMNQLCKTEEIHYQNNIEFLNLIESYNYNLESFLVDLKRTGLVHTENGILKLITEQCVCGIYRGIYYAGENKTGRVTRWLKKEMDSVK